jgi:uncharacterized protein
MSLVTLLVDGRGTNLRIRTALRWWARAVGLLTTSGLEDPCGLWISPCNSVHTLGMRYAIDVVFMNADGRIAKVVEQLPPWRAAGCLNAKSTLELRAGLAGQLGLRRGMALAFQP